MPKLTLDALSNSQVQRLKPGVDLRDGLARGLVLRMLPSGRKQWSLRYVFQGRHRRLILGEFPTLTIAKAREKAGDIRTAIRDGRDPVGEQRAAKAIRTDTVSALAADYLRLHATPRKKNRGAEDARILTRDVLPFLGDRSVRELTRREVRTVLDRIMDRKAPYAANRTLEIVRKMLNWGIRHDWLDANPAAMIEKPGVERSRERVLDDDELRALWKLLSRVPARHEKQAPGRPRATTTRKGEPFCPISPALAAVTKLRLLSAQRGGEVVRMRWADLDLNGGWWTIPGEHSKNGRPHRCPLTPAIVAIITAQPKKPDAVHVFTGREGAAVADRVKKAGAALSRGLGFKFRSHDLRRTAATRMAAAGVPREHISALLNHVQAGPVATRVYDRYTYDAEKRTALTVWDAALNRILADAPPTRAQVVPLRRRRRA